MIVSLTTDFGQRDGFPGVIKAVILSIAPTCSIVDLSHDVEPFNISAAAWLLANSYGYFSSGAVHVAVVDPGVGSQRFALSLKVGEHYFVGPDNGIFGRVLNGLTAKQLEQVELVRLDKDEYWLANVSNTFHGRDVFAPVAAHLANGIELNKLGSKVELSSIVQLFVEQPSTSDSSITGQVVYIDRYGNLITNIGGSMVLPDATCLVGARTLKVARSYSSAEPGEPIALIGSHGFLEIAVFQGRADLTLEARLSSEVTIKTRPTA